MVIKNVEKKEKSLVTFQVELDKDEFEKAVNRAYIKNKKTLVPVSERARHQNGDRGMYGHNVFYEDASASGAGGFQLRVERRSSKSRQTADGLRGGGGQVAGSALETAVYPEESSESTGLERRKTLGGGYGSRGGQRELMNARRRNVGSSPWRVRENRRTVNIDIAAPIDGVPSWEYGREANLVLGSGSLCRLRGAGGGNVGRRGAGLNILSTTNYARNGGQRGRVPIAQEVKEENLRRRRRICEDVSEFDTGGIQGGLPRSSRRESSSVQRSFEGPGEKACPHDGRSPAAMIEERMDAIFQV
jgi:hypothetical protein